MTKKKRQPKQKHVPQRTCVVCKTTRPKRLLVRIVRTAEGSVIVDETGKLSGRGAYLCRQQTCWRQAFKRHSLSRALRVSLAPEDVATLRTYVVGLPKELPEVPAAESVSPDRGDLIEEV